MKPGAQIVLSNAARLYAPLIALFALTLVVARAPGEGVGFIAGLMFALAFVVHGLIFGAAASRAAFPPLAARLCLALGIISAACGAGLPGWRFSQVAIEAGLFAATASAAALIVIVLFGRAPMLRDADW